MRESPFTFEDIDLVERVLRDLNDRASAMFSALIEPTGYGVGSADAPPAVEIDSLGIAGPRPFAALADVARNLEEEGRATLLFGLSGGRTHACVALLPGRCALIVLFEDIAAFALGIRAFAGEAARKLDSVARKLEAASRQVRPRREDEDPGAAGVLARLPVKPKGPRSGHAEPPESSEREERSDSWRSPSLDTPLRGYSGRTEFWEPSSSRRACDRARIRVIELVIRLAYVLSI
jgi:hypothetical protein